MAEEELAAQLSLLKASEPEPEVEGQSDEPSRDSSNEPGRDDHRHRNKRSSSGKGIEKNRERFVQFADDYGLNLAVVKTFVDGVPEVPQSAFDNLNIPVSDAENERNLYSPAISSTSVRQTASYQSKKMTPLFLQPVGQPGFIDLVQNQKVVLENVSVGDEMSVRGYVRVLNIAFEKYVTVRYTFDGWKNSHESTATYVLGSCDGFFDRFSFLLWGKFVKEGGSLTFCIRYTAGGGQYWDNNHGTNYTLKYYCNQSERDFHQQALHQPNDVAPSEW